MFYGIMLWLAMGWARAQPAFTLSTDVPPSVTIVLPENWIVNGKLDSKSLEKGMICRLKSGQFVCKELRQPKPDPRPKTLEADHAKCPDGYIADWNYNREVCLGNQMCEARLMCYLASHP